MRCRRSFSWAVSIIAILFLFCIAGCNTTSSSVSSFSDTSTTDSQTDSETMDASTTSAEVSVTTQSTISKTTGSNQTHTQSTASTTSKATTSTEAVNPNNKIALTFLAQETDILRQDDDATRRLVYFRINNQKGIAIKDAKITYSDGGKKVEREIGLIYLNQRYTVETMWVKSTVSGKLPVTVTNGDGNILFEGNINIQPSSKEYVIKKSKIYDLDDIKPGMLRGGNYFNKVEHWGRDWMKDDFTAEWEADFKEFSSKLNINTVRAFTIFSETLREVGNVPTSETLLKVCKFLEIADKYNVKILFCIFGGSPVPSDHQGDNLRFLRGVVEPFQNDGRIIMWDLINEPDADTSFGEPDNTLSKAVSYLYPQLRDVYATKHMTGIGTAFQLDKLYKLGIKGEVGHYHFYTNRLAYANQNAAHLKEAARLYWNDKKDPFVFGEWGYSSENATTKVIDEELQLKFYEASYGAYEILYEEGYNLLGTYQWCIYDYPENVIAGERFAGAIRKDGTVKPAGQYLAQKYAELKAKVPAPWDKK